MNKHEVYIQSLLKTNKFMLGSELNTALEKKYKLTSVAARKALQRCVYSGHIRSSRPYTFGNNQFAYLPLGEDLTKERVIQIAKSNRPPMFRILINMDLNKGIISQYEIQKLASTPLVAGKTKSDSLQKLIRDLTGLKLVEEVSHSSGIDFLIYPWLKEDAERLMAEHIAMMSLDAMFIPDVLKALQNFNVIDSKNTLYRNKNAPALGVRHNNYMWDAVSYTRTTGINPSIASKSNTPETQTLVVLDVLVSREYDQHDLNGFLARIQSVQSSVKQAKRKILPIVVYAEMADAKTINTIHKLGFLSFDLGSIFGSKIYSVLKNINALKQDQRIDDIDLEGTGKLVEDTLMLMREAGQEGNLNSLKGDLFEFLMYPVLNVLCPASNIKHGEKLSETIKGKKKEFEYDYIIDSGRLEEVIVVELKGYASSSYISLGDQAKKNSLRWFFDNSLPFALRQLKSRYKSNYKFSACYITTAGFQTDGIDFLNKQNKSKRKPKEMESWYDGKTLLALLKAKGLKKPKEIIEKYYIKD